MLSLCPLPHRSPRLTRVQGAVAVMTMSAPSSSTATAGDWVKPASASPHRWDDSTVWCRTACVETPEIKNKTGVCPAFPQCPIPHKLLPSVDLISISSFTFRAIIQNIKKYQVQTKIGHCCPVYDIVPLRVRL